MTNNRNISESMRAQRISKHAKALLELLSDVKPGSESFNVCGFVDELLAKFGMIACVWSPGDVQSIRPDLTNDQAWAVLDAARRRHDANYGVDWTTLASVAEAFFGDAPESNDSGEGQP